MRYGLSRLLTVSENLDCGDRRSRPSRIQIGLDHGRDFFHGRYPVDGDDSIIVEAAILVRK